MTGPRLEVRGLYSGFPKAPGGPPPRIVLGRAFDAFAARGGSRQQLRPQGRRSVRRRFAILSAAAFASAFGTAACGVEEQIQQRVEEQVQQRVEEEVQEGQQRVEEEVQQGRTQIEERVQDAQKQVEGQVQDVQKQVDEKAGEGQ